jgi:hypothetical protein
MDLPTWGDCKVGKHAESAELAWFGSISQRAVSYVTSRCRGARHNRENIGNNSINSSRSRQSSDTIVDTNTFDSIRPGTCGEADLRRDTKLYRSSKVFCRIA